jgi:tyrosinase
MAVWDGALPVSSLAGPGYCNHNLVTFPTWHRPYMLLYEVSLYDSHNCLHKDSRSG